MLSHCLLSSSRVAPFDRRRNSVMLGKTGVLIWRPIRIANDISPGNGSSNLIELVEKAQQQKIVRRFGDRTVEKIVLSFIVRPIRCICRAILGQFHADNRLSRGVYGRFAGYRRFDAEPGAHHPHRR